MEDEDADAIRAAERIRREARYHAAPPGLAARILAALPPEPSRGPPAVRRNARWTAVALGCALALVLAAGLVWMAPGTNERLTEELVAAHVRSMMVDHASDVASSDRHTVKPWFAGKLDYSPPVLDLTAQGFALVGGRLDYIAGRPVAALVYRHRQHLINLFVWPAPASPLAREFDVRGFHLFAWNRAGMAWWAVSDLEPRELAQFRATLEKTVD